MENKKIKVTYQCEKCGKQDTLIENEHADAHGKNIEHGKCEGISNPIHLEEVS